MLKSGIDQDALIDMVAEASAKQGEKLRKGVADATLKALQGRELTLENMRKVIKSVTQATAMGAEKNPASAVDVEGLLRKAIAGMDAALLQAVQAHRKALQQLVDQGAALRENQLKSAVAGIEKMEDMFFSTMGKAVQGVTGPMKGPWEQVLKATKLEGTASGAMATQTVEGLMAQAQDALRKGRATSMRASQVMLDSYAAMVSGVLLGMSESLSARLPSRPRALRRPRPRPRPRSAARAKRPIRHGRQVRRASAARALRPTDRADRGRWAGRLQATRFGQSGGRLSMKACTPSSARVVHHVAGHGLAGVVIGGGDAGFELAVEQRLAHRDRDTRLGDDAARPAPRPRRRARSASATRLTRPLCQRLVGADEVAGDQHLERRLARQVARTAPRSASSRTGRG